MDNVKQEIDSLINQIDNALVEIHRASKSKGHYKHFNFKKRISRLLKLHVDAKDYRPEYILNYYYIFQELYSNYGTTIVTLKEIRESDNKMVYEITNLRPNENPKVSIKESDITESTRMEIDNGSIYVGMEPHFHQTSKMACLLEHCTKEKTQTEDNIEDYSFFGKFIHGTAGIESAYKNSGFKEVPFWSSSPQHKFKNHVEELLISSGSDNEHDLLGVQSTSAESKNRLKELKVAEIAMLCRYIGFDIDKSTASEILKETKHTNVDGLINKYNALSRKEIVKAGSILGVSAKTRKKHLERVIQELISTNKDSQEAEQDLKILEKNLETEERL